VPTFSPDGGHIAWWLKRGTDAFLVVDGIVQEGSAFVESDLRFDPAGRIVYAGRVGNSHTVVVGDRRGPLADAVVPLVTAAEAYTHDPGSKAPVPFRLSADGARVAWAGWFGDQVRPVLDEEVGPPFDLILDCTIDDQGAAIWLAQRGRDIVRITRPSDRGSMLSAQ
jgi:hypothetical protein